MEEKLRADIAQLSREELENVLVNYAKQNGHITTDGGTLCKGCAGHGGECGVCICNQWVPCG